jgi:polyisoprenoid-binding protein YceI
MKPAIYPVHFLNRRLLLMVLMAIVLNIQTYAQDYFPSDKDSKISVSIKNVGMNVECILTGLKGTIHFTVADLKSSFFDVSIDANTINTGIDVRDENLKTDEYLAVKKFPRISLSSRQISRGGNPETYFFKGVLVIKGISKEVLFPFRAKEENGGWLFSGELKINRSDFKIAPASEVLSNAMTINLLVSAQKK